MPARKTRLTRRTPRNSKMIPRPGDFSRAFRGGNGETADPTLRGQRSFLPEYDSTHQTLPREIELVRNRGLTPAEHHHLARRIMDYFDKYGYFPGDRHVSIQRNPETNEYEINGVKRLRGRPRYYHDVKQMGTRILRIRSQMKELIKKYPGINILRELESHHQLTDKEIVRLARSEIFTMPRAQARKLIDEFESLELSEHNLIQQIQDATIGARQRRK